MLSVLEDNGIVSSIAQPWLIKGRAKTNAIIHSKNLNVSRSLSTVRSNRLRAATVPARTALSGTVKFPPPHKHGQAGPQYTMSIAMLHLADPPPITIGTVLRPLNLSPVWSYISYECPVVKMIAAKTANYRTNFASIGKGIPRATSIAPEVKHTQPYAFLTTQLLSSPPKLLYQTPKTTKLSDCQMPPVSVLSATATGYRASTSFSAC